MSNLIRSVTTAGRFFAVLGLGCVANVAFAEEAPSFSRDVRPILSQYCFRCHGPDDGKRESGLRLDQAAVALAPADSGKAAIVAGSPETSELVRRINSSDADEVMPPPSTKLTLTAAQKDILQRWIAAGGKYESHWAFERPHTVAPPAVSDAAWNARPIDRFAFAKLAEFGLTPQKLASPYEQVRRVYLDLTGLPPSVEIADRFAADPSDAAYEKIVDELLQSPNYGERWARKWLDLARYADTNGYEKDRARTIWPYRDWVINALQNDMSFDQFTIEQLAGDMLPNATLDQRIATGFHRNTMLNEEGGIDPLEFRFHAMTDRVATTGTVWLGLTTGCAQCHTHKYDPITHHEYYGMFALLNNADEPELPLPDKDVEAKRSEIEQKIATATAGLADRFPVPTDLVWVTPNVSSPSSANGTKLSIQPENIIRADGLSEETDTFTVTLAVPQGRFTTLRLEALADPSLPSKGPGLTPHGNFVVTEVSATLEGKPLKFADATADFAQDQFPAANAIDGKPNTGWAIHGPGEWNVNRTLTLTLAEPVESNGNQPLTVVLAHDHGGKHVLGKFRLALGQPVDTNVPVEQRRKELIAKQFDAWAKEQAGKADRWQIIKPSKATATSPLLTVLEDQSILATGDFKKSDTYEVTFDDLPSGATGLRLEVIPDERLPKGGPGAVFYEGPHGDFFLSELNIDQAGQPIKIANATQSFANGGNVAARTFDGDQQTGWSIDGGQRRRHVAVFKFDKPTEKAGPATIKMLFERYYAAGLGRFRWSYTTDSVAPANELPDDVAAILAKPADNWSADEKQAAMKAFLEQAPELSTARQEIDALRQSLAPKVSTLVMRERPANNPRPTHLHHRGEFLSPRDVVSAGTPAFLTGVEGAPKNRLEFAKWLVSASNPLTSRVIVNRAWEAFFGRGIVSTSQDFGYQGQMPTHPELLDFLAIDFMENGWSLKKLHKSIVTSRVYRQSAEVRPEALAKDPDNRWLSRGPRVRLDAEVVRDQALAVSGMLSNKRGGPSVFPPQPANVSTEGAYGGLAWNVSTGDDRWRRSLYTFTKRTAPFALLATFDAPSGEACVARREITNTPLQALSMLNDVTFLEVSRVLGKSTREAEGDDRTKIAGLFRKILIRPATSEELDELQDYLARQRKRLSAGELGAAKIVGDTASPDNALDQAAWTLVARVLLNLDETVTK